MRTYYAVDDEVDNRPFDAADMREIEAQAQREGITVDQLMERREWCAHQTADSNGVSLTPGSIAVCGTPMTSATSSAPRTRWDSKWAIVLRRGLSSKTALTITSGTRRKSLSGPTSCWHRQRP